MEIPGQISAEIKRWGSEKLPLTTEELTRAGLWAPRHMRLSFNVLWICHFP
jgi:hypothetical protein